MSAHSVTTPTTPPPEAAPPTRTAESVDPDADRYEGIQQYSLKKIVGVWEAAKGDLPKGSTVEFTKDGKLKLTLKVEDKTLTADGSYTVDGEKVNVVLKFEGQEQKQTLKIKTLTDKMLVTIDEKGMEDEFTRKK